MNDYKFTKIKSCQGIINDNITIIELPRKISLNIFLKNININYKLDENTFWGQTFIPSLIKQSLNIQYNDIQTEEKIYICPVDDLYFNTINDKPKYIIDLFGSDLNSEKKYHKQYFYEDDNYIILPDITKNYIEPNDTFLIKQDLYNIEFVLFTKKINTIFELNNDIITDIKKKIYTYINNKFPKIIINDYDIKIYTKCNSKYKFVTFNFCIFDSRNNIKYIKYTDALLYIDINDITDFSNIRCNIKIPKNNVSTTLKYCKNNNIIYDLENKYFSDILQNDFYNKFNEQNKIIEKISKKELINNKKINEINIDGKIINPDKINIIYNYYYGNENYNYCSELYLIKHEDNIYQISIKSITFDILISRDFDRILIDFNKLYKKQLSDVLSTKPFIINPDYKYWKNNLPAYYQIEIKQIDVKKEINRTFIEETKEKYMIELKKIKDSIVSDYMLMLCIYVHYKYRLNDKSDGFIKFCNIIEENKTIDLKTLMTNILIYKHFCIHDKRNTIILWYVPSFIITNWDIACDVLIKSHINDPECGTISKLVVNSFCNFYEKYENTDFIHNIRHITSNDKKDIYDLIKKYMYLKNNLDSFICIYHYPNYYIHNILHLFIYKSKEYIKRLNMDGIKRHVDYYSQRFGILHFGIDTDYMNKTFILYPRPPLKSCI
jgi:hypothetical protein